MILNVMTNNNNNSNNNNKNMLDQKYTGMIEERKKSRCKRYM